MADATTISVLIKARDQASAAFKNVETNAGRMAQGINRNRRAIGMGMLAMGAAITGVGVVMAKTAATFDSKMREVNSLIGLSQSEFQKLTDDTLEMSSAIGIDAVKASEALYQAISAGIPRENVIDFMTIASKAAIAGVTDTETAVDGLTTVMNAFKMDVGEAQRVADIMFVAVKGGKTTFEELSASMFYVAPIAAALGVEFEAIGGAAATMTKQGMPTKQAFTALRQTFVALMKPTVEMENALDQVGFASGRALLDAHGLQAGLQLLMTGTSLTEAEMTKAFGSVEAFGAVLALTGQNASEAAEDLRKSYESAGAATEAFDIINESTARQFEIMQARLKVVSIELGTVLLPIVIAITGKVSDMASKFRDFYKDHPTLVKWVGLISLALGGLLIVFGALALMLPGLIAGFTILWGVAFAPATAVILAVTAAIVAGIVIFKKWEDASVKVKIAMLALGAAILFAMGPYGLLVAAVLAGIAIWKNWDLVVSKVKKLLADTAKEVINLVRHVLVGIKAVADWLPGLKGTEEALQRDIDMLDRMSASMDDWSNETTRKTQEAADAWGAMEDGHHSTAGAVVTQNAQMGDSTSDTAKAIERALADVGGSYEDLTKKAESDTKTFADQVTYFADLNKKALEDVTKKAEEMETRLDSSLERLRSDLDETNVKWKESGLTLEDVAKRWAISTRQSIGEVIDEWDEMNLDLDDTKAVIQAFSDRTRQSIFDWRSSSIKDTEAVRDGFGQLMDSVFRTTNNINISLDDIVRRSKDPIVFTIIQNMRTQGSSFAGFAPPSIAAGSNPFGPSQTKGGDLATVLKLDAAAKASVAADVAKDMASGLISSSAGMKVLSAAGIALGDPDPFGGPRAGGGRAGGITLVGERGPELVSLPGGSFVHPNGTGPGGVTNQFHFHGAVYGLEDLREAVVEAVRDHAISGGFSGVFAEA